MGYKLPKAIRDYVYLRYDYTPVRLRNLMNKYKYNKELLSPVEIKILVDISEFYLAIKDKLKKKKKKKSTKP